jgi:hypothetical protein
MWWITSLAMGAIAVAACGPSDRAIVFALIAVMAALHHVADAIEEKKK